MNNNIISFFCLIILINNCLNSVEYETEPPENLQKIKIIYRSSDKIYQSKPIITWYNVFFIQDRILKAYNYYDEKKFTPKEFYPYENSYLKPLLQDSNQAISFFSIFFSKDCTLRVYIENKKSKLNNLKLEMKFDELDNGDNCYYSFKIYYDHGNGYAAVYSVNSNKIIVFDLHQAYIAYIEQKKFTIILDVTMKGYIKQAFIYTKNKESVLIGIDDYGNINFWNLKNYCNILSSAWNYLFSDNIIK